VRRGADSSLKGTSGETSGSDQDLDGRDSWFPILFAVGLRKRWGTGHPWDRGGRTFGSVFL